MSTVLVLLEESLGATGRRNNGGLLWRKSSQVGKEWACKYEVTPDDSTTWTVAVVPDAAFAYLENARTRRHSYDREYGGNTSGYYGFGPAY